MKHDGKGKRTIVNDGDKPKYVIRNHHEAILIRTLSKKFSH